MRAGLSGGNRFKVSLKNSQRKRRNVRIDYVEMWIANGEKRDFE